MAHLPKVSVDEGCGGNGVSLRRKLQRQWRSSSYGDSGVTSAMVTSGVTSATATVVFLEIR
jgi:hypothetical protein